MEKKKILVKVPVKKEDLFQTFPFFSVLRNEYPLDDIYIICEENCAIIFTFLPFPIKVFSRPKDKMNLIQTHHFVANLHDVFNINLYFDLENSFNSAFMGLNFRAPVRVGLDTGWNKHLLTHRVPFLESMSIEKKSMQILEKYTQKDFQDTKIFCENVDLQVVEKVDKLFNEPELPKIIMVMLNNLESTVKEIEFWKRFFDGFSNQKFIIWSWDDQDAISMIFSKIDMGRNNLTMHTGCFVNELTYIFSKISGVVTTNILSESLCSFYGVDSISIMSEAMENSSYAFYRYKPRRIRFKSENPDIFYHESEDRNFESLNAVIDYLHFQFKL
jgi:hypothetical protein